MITGPFCPGAPMWMWAAVPFMLLVFTAPVTTLSLRNSIVLTPEDCVLTGGTSCPPASIVPFPAAVMLPGRLGVCEQAETASSVATAKPDHHVTRCSLPSIDCLLGRQCVVSARAAASFVPSAGAPSASRPRTRFATGGRASAPTLLGRAYRERRHDRPSGADRGRPAGRAPAADGARGRG